VPDWTNPNRLRKRTLWQIQLTAVPVFREARRPPTWPDWFRQRIFGENSSADRRLQVNGGGSPTKKFASVFVLLCIGVAALTFKSWWRSEQWDHQTQAAEERVEALAEEREDWSEELATLDVSTRARIDSLNSWIEARAEAQSEGEARRHLDRAKSAWQEATAGLPEDLTEYERTVALKELKSTIRSWFGLTDSELAEVTQHS